MLRHDLAFEMEFSLAVFHISRLSEAFRPWVFKHPLFIFAGIGLAILKGRSATFVMEMHSQAYSLRTID